MKPETILIGWAGVDITPDKPVTLTGQFHIRVSEGVHDPVTATVLALDNGSVQAVIVSLDAVWVSDYVRNGCRARLAVLLPDFNPENLLISATHTHTAPAQYVNSFACQELNDPAIMTPEEYSEILAEKLTYACVEAWTGRRPGALSWGRGQAVVGFNRRTVYSDDSSGMYGNTDNAEFSHIEGYEDHGVDMLFTYDDQLALTGMIVNLACPSQVTEGARFVSSDFWHESRNEIRKRHGRDLFILPQCSAAGDQSPHLLLHKAMEARMMKLKGLGDDFDLGQRREIALRIAAAVDEVLPLAAKDIHRKLPFAHTVSTIDLPVWKVSPEEAEYCREQAKTCEDALTECKPNPLAVDYSSNYTKIGYYKNVVARFEKQDENPMLPMEWHVIRLGDIAFATNRFELYLDFGLRIKARSRAIQTFVVQLAGEGTYLPTARAIAGRGYGAGAPDNLVGPEGGQVLVEAQLKAINAMFYDQERIK